MVKKRRSIELLPVALQTETLSKFFAATVDHLLQPESVEFVAGYIGSKPSYYNSATDYYVSEPTKERVDYQLPVTAISVDSNSGQTTNVMFYDDLINLLKFYGANVGNHSRLFDQEYYSWSPPIDIDKFINYTKYVWVPTGPSAITLLDTTNVVKDIIGKSSYTYTGAYKLESTGEIVANSTLPISNDMLLIFSKDVNAEYVDKKFTILGVGTEIEFLPEFLGSIPAWNAVAWNVAGWNGNDAEYTKQYITIEKYSVDQNQWSIKNKWYHEDLIAISKTFVDNISSYKALRPIIEYKRNMLLWDYGWYGRTDVDLLVTNITDIFAEFVGRPSYVYDGVPLTDGMRLLVVSDTDPDINNKIYTVGGVSQYGSISLTVATDGQNADGSPQLGDRCVIQLGTYNGTNAWYTPQNYWENVGQQTFNSIGPRFALFDIAGNGFIDPSVYPLSDFDGSTIFSYVVDTNTSAVDPELGFAAKRDQFGSFVFGNTINTDVINYKVGTTKFQYTGYKFYQLRDVKTNSLTFGNGWNKVKNPSRQYVVNDFLNIQVDNIAVASTYNIDQLPATQVVGELPTIRVFRVRNQSQVELKFQRDYITLTSKVTGQPILEVSAGLVQTGDRIICKTWNNQAPKQLTGYYELPLNLTANPNNKDIDTISQSQLLDQFKQIMENQEGFDGSPLGNNNYRNTAQDRSLGLSILQHRAPMLKLMTLNSNNVSTGITSSQSSSDPMLAMQYAQREYVRFYSRFIKSLNVLFKNGFTVDNSVDDWINTALKQLNVGKTKNSPWANSGYDTLQGGYCFTELENKNYIPPTATRLGVAPAYKPLVYINGTDLVLQTHDGSRIIMEDDNSVRLGTILYDVTETSVPRLLTNPIAKAWLQFELNLYENMPTIYQNIEAELSFDIRRHVPGKWRQSEYSRAEYLDIVRPMFDKWVVLNQIDYNANTTFDLNDQFNFNYRTILDRYGESIPGNWRGMYRWYYDTDRPHTHPWEMLGFTQQPVWWETEYGPAPYTNGNTRLWADLRDGVIRQGERQGTDSVWARPGLLDCIPVDSQGNLLPPLGAGIVIGLPSIDQARDVWIFGDGGPVESLWVHSQDYNFAIPQYAYLMKPARFIEYSWDNLRTLKIYNGNAAEQWIYSDTNSRRMSNQFFVHREQPNTLTSVAQIPNENELLYFGSGGIQHWVSEYLVGKNLNITTYFGNLVRGSEPRLAHKIGAYINSNDSSLRLTVDSFGNIGYKSQLVPSENVKTYLYKSSSIGESFYGGVIVKQIRNGWQVYGYDGVFPFFNTIPSDVRSSKTTLTIGNQRMILYSKGVFDKGQPITNKVPYGTIFSTRQDVFDFIISYGRWLEDQGWQFDAYDSDNNILYNWKQAATEFSYWSQAVWANGNFIALSPLANEAKFTHPFGNIEFVNGVVKGTYPVLDRSGAMIDAHNLEILRYEDEIVVRSLNEQTIYGLRLYRTTVEHIIVLDNLTSFNDTIYNDLFGLAQPRIKMYAYRTNDWSGRLDAPGYFLYQNPADNTWSMISNLEKTANDFRKYYNIEQPKNYEEFDSATNSIVVKSSDNSVVDRNDISDLSKHMFGYQKRPYLQDLLLENSTEFEFYQGFIKQKGTKTTIDKILRNSAIVSSDEQFEYYEEFALRVGRYGSVALNTGISFVLREDEFVNTPQQINLFGELDSTRQANGIIQLIPNDPDYINQPADYNNDKFPLRTYLGQNYKTDLPTAGYVKLGETDWYVKDRTALLSLYNDNAENERTVQDRDTIWQFIDVKDGWLVWQVTRSPVNILNTTPSDQTGEPTTINCDGQHGLIDGDTITLVNVGNVDVLNGTWTVQNVNASGNTFQVPQNSFTVGFGGDIYVYQKVRFGNVSLRDQNPPVGGWENGDTAWVDQGDIGINGWAVYTRIDNQWIPTRTENYKVNAELMTEASLYSIKPSKKLVALTYYDPAKGFIPGMADEDIDIKSISDPAKYNRGDTDLYAIDAYSAWGKERVGDTWWDLSAVRYIDYEIDDDSYRWKNWGKIAPGTSVDIYEWVRSPVPPSNWASYVTQGQSFSQYGINYSASGRVKNPTNPGWTQEVEYDQNGIAKTWYYFWVSNATTLPFPSNRTKTTLEIANILQNPNSYGVSWYAAIDQENIIVSNIVDYLDSTNTFMEMIYTQKSNNGNDHKQWELVRQGDSSSTINEYFWLKLQNSLVGFDGLGNPVPDITLNEYQRYGTLIRPRQSWFKNRSAAAKVYVEKINNLMKNIALRDDPDRATWVNWLFDEEPLPSQPNNYDYIVDTIDQRNALSILIQDGQRVLVLPVAENLYRWVIYRWSLANRTWVTERIQAWKTANYWQYIDYYSEKDNVSNVTVPNYTVDTLNDRASVPATIGTIVKILNNGFNLWELYKYTADGWIRVGLEAGTIEILTAIYDTTGYATEFGADPYDETAYDINPFVEFGNIFNAVKFTIFGSPTNSNSIELNDIFFTMINYVLAEQGFVDWIIKTSYIVLKGFSQNLYTGDLYTSDTIDSLLNYINEVRPYRSKIREFISKRTTNDLASLAVTDYDKPVYDDRILNQSNINDANILATDSTLKFWYNNYQRNPQLIRTMKTTILFDRIASRSIGWESLGWDQKGWEFETGTDASFSAFDRIKQYYQPTAGMIPIDSEDLISGSAYKGVILSGLGFEMSPGWNKTPWNTPVGWNAKAVDFDRYLDLIIQGGVIPEYDSFYGNSIKKAFKLSKVPQDVANTVVWSNNVLRQYGIDWVIPNWVANATVVARGVDYQVGEILEIAITNAVVNPTVRVETIDAQGGIKTVSIVTKGSIDMVPAGSLDLVYRLYREGAGTGAIVQPVWGGDTLVLNDAPGGEINRASVYVLYSGETFNPAPDGEYDIVNDGSGFIQPLVAQDHAEELYNAKLKDSLRLDVYTSPTGGSPTVFVRSYQSDGVIDQFDLSIKPQNEKSVIAVLNGRILEHGIDKDYVINFLTNKLVFITPPDPGNLQLTTITTGGTGIGLEEPYVVEPGQNYEIGDIITLTNGSEYDLAGGAGRPAKVAVVALSAVDLVIVDGGVGYTIDDTLILKDLIDTESKYKLSLKVADVSLTGAITKLTIDSTGYYYFKPDAIDWIATSTGVGADISIVWGAAELAVNDQGLYSDNQKGPFTQLSIMSPSIGTIGSDIVVNATMTNTLGTAVFIADGQTNAWTVPFRMIDTTTILITVDGARVEPFNTIVSVQTVAINFVPDENAVVVITSFSSNRFSVVREFDFEVLPDVNPYYIDFSPASTQPQYASSIVLKNNVPMKPPPINTYIADGVTNNFAVTYLPPFNIGLYVYINSIRQTETVDYSVTSGSVVFATPPEAGAKVVMVVTYVSYGYEYAFNGNALEFVRDIPTGWDALGWDSYYGWENNDSTVEDGDRIRVITFTEDLSYGWLSEEFISAGTNTYTLQSAPFNNSAIFVLVDDSVKTLMWDYTLERLDDGRAVIQFNKDAAPAYGSSIIVTYGTGVDDRPPIAWRTLISPVGETTSIAIDNSRKTNTLSSVYSYSNSIEIFDLTKVNVPTALKPGAVWINNELVYYYEIESAPTIQYPNRGFLNNLRRGVDGTPSDPVASYNTQYYYGDGVTRYFATESGTTPITETVYVNGKIQVKNSVNSVVGTYTVEINPIDKPAGRYIVFNNNSIPPAGWKNIRIVSLNVEASNNVPVHVTGATVIDAGDDVKLPGGTYIWQPAPNGLQYSDSNQAKFLRDHPGTRS
jgi:hypothetical protein